jgi:hypothetical protein
MIARAGRWRGQAAGGVRGGGEGQAAPLPAAGFDLAEWRTAKVGPTSMSRWPGTHLLWREKAMWISSAGGASGRDVAVRDSRRAGSTELAATH